MKRRGQININIPLELKESFYMVCKKNHINPSAIIRSWIIQFVKNGDETYETLPTDMKIKLARNRKGTRNNKSD